MNFRKIGVRLAVGASMLAAATFPAMSACAVPAYMVTQGFIFGNYYPTMAACQLAAPTIFNMGYPSPPPVSCVPINLTQTSGCTGVLGATTNSNTGGGVAPNAETP